MLSLPSTSSSISRKKYDVFLSFRGEDTRKNFTDHLYDALKRSGILTFRDDPKLEAGQEIAPELFKAIQQSWCSVIIFSESYASSGWCLDELTEIVKQKNEKCHKVFPIFYNVDPSDLRRQKGKVEEAFVRHEERYKKDKDKVQRWRNALSQVADIKGWYFNDRHEAEFIGDIVKKISEKLCQTYPVVIHDELVGMSSRLEELYSKIEIGEDDVRIIGICGMGGIGKTTLTRVVYNQMSSHFEGKTFLADVRDWFGLGSRIIVTSRDEHLLRTYGVDHVYESTTLNDNDALRLFNLKAFGSDALPDDDFIELSEQVVKYAGGLPLALEVLASFLCGREATQWRSAIERLKRHSNKEILDRLRISFDGLDETEQSIFLDIACFFNREKKDFVTKVLDGCEFFPDIGIEVLVKKSLVKADERSQCLWMHDLLQEMGRRIVREKCVDEPGKRCRLWDERDVHHVLTNNTGTEVIEGMFINNKMLNLSSDAFAKMKKMRLLKVYCLAKSGDLNYLSNELRLLDWRGYPLRSLPCSFQPENLVALILCYSRIEQLWKGKRPMYKLKVMNLKGSVNLITTPDLSMAPDLEILILEGCTRIVDVHPSIGALMRLKLLNLRGCKSLGKLPTIIGMESLETLILSGCSNLQSFPQIDGKMECLKSLDLSGCYKVENFAENLQQAEFLEELDLSETGITKLPSFIFRFKNLKSLSLNGCRGSSSKLRINPPSLFKAIQFLRGRTNSMALTLPSLSGLSSLTELKLRECNLREGDIPSDVSCLSSLTTLDLSGNNFITIPSSFTQLLNLQFLALSNCKELKSLPELLTNTASLWIDGCASLEVVASPLKACNSMAFSFIKALNCFRLAENMNALTLMRFANSRRMFDVIIPGREIPEWFSKQQRGESSIKISLPNHSEWIGVALCCIFVNDDASREEDLMCKAVIQGRDHREVVNSGWTFGKEYNEPIKKEHLFVRFCSRDKLYPFSRTGCFNQEYDELVLSFRAARKSVKVKKCGVRIVYEKDLEDMEHSNQSCAEIEEYMDEDTNANGSFVKRKRNVYEETEAGPQPKRIQKFFNSIIGGQG